MQNLVLFIVSLDMSTSTVRMWCRNYATGVQNLEPRNAAGAGQGREETTFTANTWVNPFWVNPRRNILASEIAVSYSLEQPLEGGH